MAFHIYPYTADNTAYKLSDAHAHLGSAKELKSRKSADLCSLICASTPPEAERLRSLAGEPQFSSVLLPTYGLHPWHAAEYRTSDMTTYFSDCSVIGEIGMDSVWCDVPLKIQEQVFREQLQIASRQGKPVILHTKGQENEIAEIIREYPNTYLVHWYSSGFYLENYIKQDCYFSIGPDVWWNPAVQKRAKSAPLNRILIETDGMGAVKWAYKQGEPKDTKDSGGSKTAECPATPYDSLINTLETTANIRQCSAAALAKQIGKNFSEFVGGGR